MIKKSIALLLGFTLILTVFFTGCGETNNNTAEMPDQAEVISPLLWKAEGKNGSTMYLFGTIHCGDKRSEEVMAKLGSILDECPELAVEFDVVKYNEKIKENPLSAADDLAQFMYTDGTTIKDHIPEKLYKGCVEILRDAGMYNSMSDYYNPNYWSTFVTNALIKKSGLSTDYAMDSLLLERAHKKNTGVTELESAEEQFRMLADFSDGLVEMQLQETVDTKKEAAASLNAMYETWLSGDEEALTKLAITDTNSAKNKEQEKYIDEYMEKFLIRRNTAMADKAEDLLNGKKNTFLAVGAAHLLENYGIVQILKARGYNVERVFL